MTRTAADRRAIPVVNGRPCLTRIGLPEPGTWDLRSLIEALLMVMGAGLRTPGWAVSYRLAAVLTLAAAPPARLVAAVRGVRHRRW